MTEATNLAGRINQVYAICITHTPCGLNQTKRERLQHEDKNQ